MQNSTSKYKLLSEEQMTPFYDVIIIGGGVIGSLISYYLSKYNLSICLLEKNSDLAMEESGANSAIIHAGFDAQQGSLKAQLNVNGNFMMEQLCQDLQVPFVRNGALVLAFNKEDMKLIEDLYERGKTNNVPELSIISKEEVLEMEPIISQDILGALFAPSSGIINPFELTLAASEIANQNGVDYYFEHEVISINSYDNAHCPPANFSTSTSTLNPNPNPNPNTNTNININATPTSASASTSTSTKTSTPTSASTKTSTPTSASTKTSTPTSASTSTSTQNSSLPLSSKSQTVAFEIKCKTPTGKNTEASFRCHKIINASGVCADKISNMAGDFTFQIIPRKGEYIVMDKVTDNKVRRTIFQPPTPKGKGVLVTPTVDGNMLIGPNSKDVFDPFDNRTTAEGMNEIWDMALKSVPSLNKKWMIRSFAGIRSTASTHDFIIGESMVTKEFFQAAGIDSPGLSSSPAIAKKIENLIINSFKEPPNIKKNYIKLRNKQIHFSDQTIEEQQELILKDSKYAKIICRCENITEAQIIESIRRPLGARTINGVKLRTRAGTGRCQSGFCMPKILEILARETGVPREDITLFGAGSEIVMGRTREIKN